MEQIIYALIDPRDKKIRYIGYTGNKSKRMAEHLREACKKYTSHKHHWIASLLSNDVVPEMIIIEIVDDSTWRDREKYWIKFYEKQLANSTDGGEGLVNPSQEIKDRISKKVSEILKGNKRRLGIAHTAESKKAISEGIRVSLKSQAHYAGMKGKKVHPSFSEAALKAAKAPKSEKHKKAIGEALKNSEAFKVANVRKVGRKIPKASAKKIGRRWCNNGVEMKQLTLLQRLPTGWNFGMIKKVV